jgi:lipopolysaccharide biosynthesis glycosyltransferase
VSAAMSEAPVTIALAADATFCRQLAVVISGISRWASDLPHRIFVFHDGYDATLREVVAESATDGVELRWIDARSVQLDSAILDHYPPSTLFRLRMEDLMPAEVERLIYLDADTLVRAPLTELWKCELGGALVGAVRDAGVPWVASPRCLDWRQFGLPPDMPYFNAGMLVIPLDRWRARRVSERALGLLSRHAFLYADQCSLNITIAGDWRPLEPRWNLQAAHIAADSSFAWVTEPTDLLDEARRDPALIHFNGDTYGWRRPWESRCTHPLRELWYEELDRTAWAGWRPKEPNRVDVLARRVKRAGRVIVRGP